MVFRNSLSSWLSHLFFVHLYHVCIGLCKHLWRTVFPSVCGPITKAVSIFTNGSRQLLRISFRPHLKFLLVGTVQIGCFVNYSHCLSIDHLCVPSLLCFLFVRNELIFVVCVRAYLCLCVWVQFNGIKLFSMMYSCCFHSILFGQPLDRHLRRWGLYPCFCRLLRRLRERQTPSGAALLRDSPYSNSNESCLLGHAVLANGCLIYIWHLNASFQWLLNKFCVVSSRDRAFDYCLRDRWLESQWELIYEPQVPQIYKSDTHDAGTSGKKADIATKGSTCNVRKATVIWEQCSLNRKYHEVSGELLSQGTFTFSTLEPVVII